MERDERSVRELLLEEPKLERNWFRPFSAAATSDKRDPAIRGVACVGGWYAVVDAGNDCATVIGDALSPSASSSR